MSSSASGKGGILGKKWWQLRKEQVCKYDRKAHDGSGRVSRESSVQGVSLIKKSFGEQGVSPTLILSNQESW